VLTDRVTVHEEGEALEEREGSRASLGIQASQDVEGM
jgi:hypothetical protein